MPRKHGKDRGKLQAWQLLAGKSVTDLAWLPGEIDASTNVEGEVGMLGLALSFRGRSVESLHGNEDGYDCLIAALS